MPVKYDVFICHASEDKEDFVRPLAEALRESHVEVWYDEFTLEVGDSLRRSIDAGLLSSRHGIVVLSQAFFKKQWPQRELDGLTARQLNDNHKIILPIWHNITQTDVLNYSPPLADNLAIDTKEGLDKVCQKLLKVIRPEGSPLVVARDTLLKYGVKVPVVTDEWWLDVVEASNRQEKKEKYDLKEKREWGRWTFPLPKSSLRGKDRGTHLAWTAMQMEWEQKATNLKITQITRPEIVHNFIDSMPGLKELCYENPILLAEYAPQLTVNGNSGEFDNVFDELLLKPIERWYRAGETTTAGFPLCIEQIALRHESFGDYNPAIISENFIQGGMYSGFYEEIDYLVWLTLPDSSWLSKHVRNFLIDGITLRGHWKDHLHGGIWEPDHKYYGSTFRNAINKAKDFKSFKFTPKVIESLKELIEYSRQIVESSTPLNKAFDCFIEHGVIEKHFEHKALRQELGYNYGLRRRPFYLW